MSKDKQMPDKADLKSLDISAANREQLKQLFPSVFTETKNDDGELVESLDFGKLQAELGTFSDVFESRRERYGMDWPGKKDCMKLIQKPSVATLKPCREESVNFDETENLFIEGDNLEVLKLLQKSYYGKIKMIYIDPPYNTGKEFIYPDDYSESLDTYLAYAGLVDSEGRKFSTNTANEGRFHTKWLNMMYPRIYLARNLLSETGLIFVSIDQNESARLRLLLDDVFGEEHFVSSIVWEKRVTRSNNAKMFATLTETVFCYRKSAVLDTLREPRSEKANSIYSNPDGDPRGLWTSVLYVNPATKEKRPNLAYPVTNPITGAVVEHPTNAWKYSRETHEAHVREDRLFWGKDGGHKYPRLKKFLSEVEGGMVPVDLWARKETGTTDKGSKMLEKLMGGKVFDFPKPHTLVKRAINICDGNDFIVLDFFAGSAPSAHAVFDQNKDDGGSRKFILVQLPEPCEENSEAARAGYKTIADVAKERVRRAAEMVNREMTQREKEASGDLLKSVDEFRELDLGFKVLKLDKSNFSIWDGSKPDTSEEAVAEQLDSHIDHVDSKASQEDILYELLLKAGFKPTEDVEQRKFADKAVFSIADGLLLICLEDEITKDLIDAVAEAEPMQFICLDRGFKGNDQLKANAVQTFAARNQGRDKTEQIIFRTI